MSTITIKGIVHISAHGNPGKPSYVIFNSDMSDYGHTPIGPIEVPFELPEAFSPQAVQIAMLEKQREKVNREFGKAVKNINEQIAKLQAIEYVQEVA